MVYVGGVHDIYHSVRKCGDPLGRGSVVDETILTLSDRVVLYCSLVLGERELCVSAAAAARFQLWVVNHPLIA